MSAFPVAPNWTVLPPLALRGLGSELVESLEHYLSRLGAACAAPPQKLAQQVWLETGRVPNNNANGRFAGSLLRHSGFVSKLERLTGVDHLHCGTWRNLSETVLDARISINGHRWCPSCFLEWDAQHSWEPLAWSLSALRRCPHHSVLLVSRCSECGARQPKRRTLAQRRKCTACKQALGYRAEASSPTYLERWTDSMILDLVSVCGDPSLDVIPATNVSTLISSICQDARLTGRPPAFVEFRRKLLKRVASGKLTLEGVVNLCALQHTTPRVLLMSPLEAAAPPLLADWTEFVELPLPTASFTLSRERAATILNELARRPGLPLLPYTVVLDVLRLSHQILAPFSPIVAAYERACQSQTAPPNSMAVHRTIRSALHLVSERLKFNACIDHRKIAANISVIHSTTIRIARWAVRAAARLLSVQRDVDAVFLSAKNWKATYRPEKTMTAHGFSLSVRRSVNRRRKAVDAR